MNLVLPWSLLTKLLLVDGMSGMFNPDPKKPIGVTLLPIHQQLDYRLKRKR